ncbi:reduced viability upon starvation protein [Acrasis kona]|uniref:Reduced viability upon starvation protein n=1 Tax=Acrasis kona TaxID=1008807 RepID=A0AAW2YW83_9EUKA
MSKFKSFVHRTKDSINVKFGKDERTIDEDYEVLARKFETIATAATNYNKHVQQFIENFHSMSTTMTFLAEDMSDLYKNSDDQYNRQLSDKVMEVATDCEVSAVRPFQDQITDTVVIPLNDFIAKFEPCRQLCKQRATKLQEYDYYKTKVKKLMEKPNKDPMKLPNNKTKMNQHKDELDLIQTQSMEKFTEIIQEQPIVFGPVAQKTINALLNYSSKLTSSFNRLQEYSVETVAVTRTATDYAPVSLKPLPTQQTTTSFVKPSATVVVPPKYDCDWFYLNSALAQEGPITFAQLASKFKTMELNDSSYVFGGDLSDWKPISEMPDLKRYLN